MTPASINRREGSARRIASNPKDASLQDELGRCFYQLGDYNTRSPAWRRPWRSIPPAPSITIVRQGLRAKAEESNPFSALSLARKAHREFTERFV